jgi:DNA replication protein DnaC
LTRQATLVTSQLPVEHWHDLIGDPTFGDAILDRLVHGAHRITLKGRSMRRQDPTTNETNKQPTTKEAN